MACKLFKGKTVKQIAGALYELKSEKVVKFEEIKSFFCVQEKRFKTEILDKKLPNQLPALKQDPTQDVEI